MARRRNSLTITTILKKAQRQGVSAFTMDILLERLRALSGQREDKITDDARISVDKMLQDGIRLHPFLIQPGPITPDQLEDLRLESARSRRLREAARVTEDLSLPPQEEPTQAPTEDLSVPNPLLLDVEPIVVP